MKRSYTPEQREEAVKMVFNGNHPNDVSKKLGIPLTTIYSWVARAKKPIRRLKKSSIEPIVTKEADDSYNIKYKFETVPVKEKKLAAIIGTPSEIAEALKNL